MKTSEDGHNDLNSPGLLEEAKSVIRMHEAKGAPPIRLEYLIRDLCIRIIERTRADVISEMKQKYTIQHIDREIEDAESRTRNKIKEMVLSEKVTIEDNKEQIPSSDSRLAWNSACDRIALMIDLLKCNA